jgi:hypothetical protein
MTDLTCMSLLIMTDDTQIYYGGYATFGSVPFRFSTVTSLQRSTIALQLVSESLFIGSDSSAMGTITRVRDFYEALDVRSELKNGDRLYPCEFSNEMGMEIVLRYVGHE